MRILDPKSSDATFSAVLKRSYTGTASTFRPPIPEKWVQVSGRRFYNPEIGRWLNRDPIGVLGGINLFEFIYNSAPNYHDRIGLFCGECSPPHPRYPNYYRPKLKGIVHTTVGTNPFSDHRSLIDTIETYQNVIGIVETVTGFVNSLAELTTFFAEWAAGMVNPADYTSDQREAIDNAINQFEGTLQSLYGVNVYLEIEHEECLPCGKCKHKWEKKTSFYQCLEGSYGPAPHRPETALGTGAYGGGDNPALTLTKLSACIASWESAGPAKPENSRLKLE